MKCLKQADIDMVNTARFPLHIITCNNLVDLSVVFHGVFRAQADVYTLMSVLLSIAQNYR